MLSNDTKRSNKLKEVLKLCYTTRRFCRLIPFEQSFPPSFLPRIRSNNCSNPKTISSPKIVELTPDCHQPRIHLIFTEKENQKPNLFRTLPPYHYQLQRIPKPNESLTHPDQIKLRSHFNLPHMICFIFIFCFQQ